jgi:ubiquinone/menaquinone biosynthesis C-methylase UbiE
VRFVRADAARLPFADRSFDVVTGHSFLYLVPDAEGVLREVRRVLRPGGRCVFLEPNADSPDALVPPEILAHAASDPRFVAAMALWRVASRAKGRFDERRFTSHFGAAGLSLVACEPTLAGLGLYGVAVRQTEPA